MAKVDEVKNISIETRDNVSQMNRAGLNNPKDSQSDIKQSLSSDQVDNTITDEVEKEDGIDVEKQVIDA